MGFKRGKQLVRLEFEDSDLSGFECTMNTPSLGLFLEINRLQDDTKKSPEEVERLFAVFGDLLESWNLECDDDTPVPATYDGLKAQDQLFVKAIVRGYMRALASIPKVLSRDSSSGETSEAESLGLGMSYGNPES